jgi:hypothetical protein
LENAREDDGDNIKINLMKVSGRAQTGFVWQGGESSASIKVRSFLNSLNDISFSNKTSLNGVAWQIYST